VKIDVDAFRVPEGAEVHLGRRPTRAKPLYESRKHYRSILAEHVRQLSDLQSVLYAADRYALLLVFQGMDAAGKDSAIKHVLSGVNPQGCEVTSFKQPSDKELQHDFLWRTTCCLPDRGRIGIFNRSYYEEVLVVRVHPEILAARKIPLEAVRHKEFWKERYESIRDLEKHLHRSGTRIIKFFLHVSKEQQRKRFLKRIDDPARNWKFSEADVRERERWHEYRKAYEACLGATSTDRAPWYVVPADDKKNARLIISQTIVDTLKDLRMSYPTTGPVRRKELLAIRAGLAK